MLKTVYNFTPPPRRKHLEATFGINAVTTVLCAKGNHMQIYVGFECKFLNVIQIRAFIFTFLNFGSILKGESLVFPCPNTELNLNIDLRGPSENIW